MICPSCGEDTEIHGIATVEYEFELRYDKEKKIIELHDERVVDYVSDDMDCFCKACESRFDEDTLLAAQGS